MSLLHGLRYRLRALLHPGRFTRELEEEQAFHLELEAMQRRHAGADTDEARFAALRRFGNRSRQRETIRDRTLVGRLDPVAQDLRYAVRRLRRSPGLALAVVLTLGIGIGASSAIFSVVNGVLLRTLPFAQPEQLVALFTADSTGARSNDMSAPNFMSLREERRAFVDLSVYDLDEPTLTGHGEPRVLPSAQVSAGFFEVLGARPLAGRTFLAEDNARGAAPVVVLGHAFARQTFGDAARSLGARLVLNDVPRTVVGVMPPGFGFPEERALWTPLRFDDSFSASETGNRRTGWLSTVARLRPGVRAEQAAAELDAVAARLQARFPETNTNVRFGLLPLREELVGEVRTPLLLLFGAVGFVLLIACANVVGLLLAQAAARRQELAVRAALGAGTRRLARQLLVECLVLALLGGTLGLVLAATGTRALLALHPGGIPRLGEVRVDGLVLLFTLAVSLGVSLLVGIVPAWRAGRAAQAEAVREGGRGGVGSRRGGQLRDLLVAAELALAVVLLAGAGLLARSFGELVSQDPGFRAQGGIAFRVALPRAAYGDDARVRTFYEQLVARVAALPGVSGAAAVSRLPLATSSMTVRVDVEGRPVAEAWRGQTMGMRSVTPDYFRAMAVPLRGGRAIAPTDDERAPRVVVINETAARRYFGNQPALGQRLRFSWSRLGGAWHTVVGVVGDLRHERLDAPPEPEAFVPHAQLPVSVMHVVVRTGGDPLAGVRGVRGVLRDLDPRLPLDDLRTLEQVVADSVARPRFLATLLVLFAAIALGLSALGIFGLLNYGVTQQAREIGVRLALGASPAGVVAMLLHRVLRLVVVGLGLGIVAALALGRVVEGLLYGVSATDPITMAGVVLVLGATAALATALPARRAAGVDPVVALRQE